MKIILLILMGAGLWLAGYFVGRVHGWKEYEKLGPEYKI